MRIAMVSEHASPLALLGGADAGGQNVHVAELARSLGRLGVEVTVHTRRDDPALAPVVAFADNVTVHHVDAGPAEPIAKDHLLAYMGDFARRLRSEWERRRPDVVHSHFWMSGLASVEAARDLTVPVLHTFHALGLEKRRHQGARDTSPAERIDIEAELACHADRLVVTTEAEASEVRRMGARPDRVVVVPCGVDHRLFSAAGPRWPPPGRCRRRVVVASRLVERKGVGNVIEALVEVPDTELVVAGGPPAPLLLDDPEAARLHERAEELGVLDRVLFVGSVPRERMPALLRSATVVACCPWYEPFGIVAVEAMAVGRPVLATRVGGLAETVRPGITGALVPPRDPEGIASALRSMLSDPAGLAAMGAAAVERAARYSWDRIGAETLAVARGAVRASGPMERGFRR